MNDLSEAPTISEAARFSKTLPVIFINREGEPEMGSVPIPSFVQDSDERPSYIQSGEAPAIPRAARLPLATALNRLRRALFETGQLIVTTDDGLTRVCFAGVGDPERLFVEAVPRDVAVPSMDGSFPGTLCSLPHAEALLRRLFRGERGPRIEATLKHLSDRRILRGLSRAHAEDELHAA